MLATRYEQTLILDLTKKIELNFTHAYAFVIEVFISRKFNNFVSCSPVAVRISDSENVKRGYVNTLSYEEQYDECRGGRLCSRPNLNKALYT